MSMLHELRAACLPFVTRSLRGPRKRRTLILSGLLALITVLSGLWIATGPGRFEREMRSELGFETPRWEREYREFLIIADDDWELADLERERDRLLGDRHAIDTYDTVSSNFERAMDSLAAAGRTRAPLHLRDLQDDARTVLQHHENRWVAQVDMGAYDFPWRSPEEVERLRAIVAADGIPNVVVYQSPITAADTLRIIGLAAASAFAVLMLMIAPLLTGVQLAQEVHENTLVPLTGTALSRRQLALGLLSGPLSVVAILAVPHLLVFTAAAAATGFVAPALGFLVMTVAGTVVLVMLTQLVGLAMGRKRTPGIVGIGLLAVLGLLFMAGMGFGLNLDGDTLGVVSVLPQAGVFHLLRETFGPAGRLGVAEAIATDWRLLAGGLGFMALSVPAALAFERRIGGTRGAPSLRRPEAIGTAVVIAGLAVLAVPPDAAASATYVASLAVALMPLGILLMGRVPMSNLPAAMRVIPLGSLLLEFAAFMAIHAGLVLLATGHVAPVTAEGIGLMSIASLIVALIAIRAVAGPVGIGAAIWVTFCAMLALLTFVSGAVWGIEGGSVHMRDDSLFVFEKLSPVLGLVQAMLTVVVPWSLIRMLRPRRTKGD